MISFIIPAYNEEKNVIIIHRRLTEMMTGFDYAYEIVFINDGSFDGTLNRLKLMASSNSNIKIIDFSRNFGHQSALTAGMKYAKGDAVISMDCDLQDPPELIPEMIQKWKEGSDIVYARRKNYRKDNFIKKFGSKIYYRIFSRFTHVDIPRNVGDFRLVDKKVLTEINRMREHSRYLRGMVAWTGFQHTFVDYYRPDRQDGVSSYTFGKLAALGMDGMVNFSVLPLRLGFILGLISTIIGFFLLSYQALDTLITGAYYHLYKWLIVILFIFMGFLFMLMWIIGEYIGKIYDEVRDRPMYVIKDQINFQD